MLFWFILFVFGTYGTFKNNLDSTGTIYLIYVFPICIIFFGIIFLYYSLVNSRINTKFISSFEFQLLISICLITFLSTLQIPQYILTSILTLISTILIFITIFNLPFFKIDVQYIFLIFNRTLYFTAILALIGGLFSFFGESFSVGPIEFYYEKAYWRMNSWYVSSTGLGLLFMYGVYSSIYFIKRTNLAFVKFWFTVSIIALIFGMTLAGGRTAFICIAFSFLITFFYKTPLKPVFLIRLLIILFVIALFSIFIFNTYSEEIYILRRFSDEDASSFGGRSDLFSQYIESFNSLNIYQYIFGVGINGTREILKWQVSPHSGFLRIYIENGPIAFLLFIILILVTSVSLQQRVRHSQKFKTEFYIICLYLTSFFLSEIMVIQLFGISMEYILFIIIISFFGVFKFIDKNNMYL
jgi:O-antigen ligase